MAKIAVCIVENDIHFRSSVGTRRSRMTLNKIDIFSLWTRRLVSDLLGRECHEHSGLFAMFKKLQRAHLEL